MIDNKEIKEAARKATGNDWQTGHAEHWFALGAIWMRQRQEEEEKRFHAVDCSSAQTSHSISR